MIKQYIKDNAILNQACKGNYTKGHIYSDMIERSEHVEVLDLEREECYNIMRQGGMTDYTEFTSMIQLYSTPPEDRVHLSYWRLGDDRW